MTGTYLWHFLLVAAMVFICSDEVLAKKKSRSRSSTEYQTMTLSAKRTLSHSMKTATLTETRTLTATRSVTPSPNPSRTFTTSLSLVFVTFTATDEVSATRTLSPSADHPSWRATVTSTEALSLSKSQSGTVTAATSSFQSSWSNETSRSHHSSSTTATVNVTLTVRTLSATESYTLTRTITPPPRVTKTKSSTDADTATRTIALTETSTMTKTLTMEVSRCTTSLTAVPSATSSLDHNESNTVHGTLTLGLTDTDITVTLSQSNPTMSGEHSCVNTPTLTRTGSRPFYQNIDPSFPFTSTHSLTLSGRSWQAVLANNSSNLRANVQADIARSLSLPLASITINAMKVGSLVVELTVVRQISDYISDEVVNILLATGEFNSTVQYYRTVTPRSNESIQVLSTAVLMPSNFPQRSSSSSPACTTNCIIAVSSVVGGVLLLSVAAVVWLRVRRMRRNRLNRSVTFATCPNNPIANGPDEFFDIPLTVATPVEIDQANVPLYVDASAPRLLQGNPIERALRLPPPSSEHYITHNDGGEFAFLFEDDDYEERQTIDPLSPLREHSHYSSGIAQRHPTNADTTLESIQRTVEEVGTDADITELTVQ